MTSRRPIKSDAPTRRSDRLRSSPTPHRSARHGGLRVSARHLRTEPGRPAPDPMPHRLARGRAVLGAGLALLAAAAVLFAVALVASRIFGR
jgi:hypothetical protein